MAGTINPHIGSGIQGHRKVNHGHWNGVTTTVAVVNFEDEVAVYAFDATAVSIPTGAAVKLPSGTSVIGRRIVAVNNAGGSPVYVGGTSGVTIANGYPISVGTEKAFSIGSSLDIWCIASGVPGEVRVLEIA